MVHGIHMQGEEYVVKWSNHNVVNQQYNRNSESRYHITQDSSVSNQTNIIIMNELFHCILCPENSYQLSTIIPVSTAFYCDCHPFLSLPPLCHGHLSRMVIYHSVNLIPTE